MNFMYKIRRRIRVRIRAQIQSKRRNSCTNFEQKKKFVYKFEQTNWTTSRQTFKDINF